MELFELMKNRLELAEPAWLVTVVDGERQGDKVLYNQAGDVLHGTAIEGVMQDTLQMAGLIQLGSMEIFVEPVERDPEILILGAGHVSRCIAHLFTFIGYRVTVVDDRSHVFAVGQFPDTVDTVCLPFHKLADVLPLSRYAGFVVVTRAHEFDSVCLAQLRDQLPTYIGVMGSKKRIRHAFAVLESRGWRKEELAQIHAPIGLDIGAETPEEIAISIVAEYLTVVRDTAGQPLSERRKSYEA